jgi:esterase/lipase superfamily enzyme
MFRRSWWLILLLIFSGCDSLRSKVVEQKSWGIIYDTKYEATLNSGKSLPLLEEAWRGYVEVLAEPAAIIACDGPRRTWEVYFATNRGLEPSVTDPEQVRGNNQVAKSASYGRAEITLPRRRRGVDPQREGEHAGNSDTVKFEAVRQQEAWQTAEGIRAQLARSRQRDLLLFVHGFNVDFESALIRTAQIAYDMPFNGAVVAYSWPTQSGITKYRADEQINADSVAPFADFLRFLVAAVPPDTRINIVAHSMGNRIVMQGIGQLPAEERKQLAHVALCAPDVGLSDFQRWLPGVLAHTDRVTLYASSGDTALKTSKWLHREQRAGDANPPVVVAGVETIDCSDIDFDFMGHSYYGSNVDVLSDLFAALKQQQRADQRPYLKPQALNEGEPPYWSYHTHAPKMLWTWNFEENFRRYR